MEASETRDVLYREGGHMSELQGKNVAMVLAANFEDVEAIDPKDYLEERGAKVTVIGLEMGEIAGKKGGSLSADATFDKVKVGDFDLLVIPGGGSPENLRVHDNAVQFTRDFAESGKPVAAICHGAQLLISADVIQNKTITCVNKIRDDVKNAGAKYVDEALVTDGNFITSRVPGDLPVFNQAVAESLARVTVGD